MKVYEASPKSRGEVVEVMRSFIDGDGKSETFFEGDMRNLNILESFYYLRKHENFMDLVGHFGSFLLDSGAYTFMAGSHKGAIDWDEYVESYAKFINKYDVRLFFELDIDSVVGLEEVERLRANSKP